MKTAFFCQDCGYKSLKWLGRCPGCGNWNSLVEETLSEDGPAHPHPVWEKTKPRPISEIKSSENIRRKCGIGEFDRILGGGIVDGSLILVGGEPGIGKSTILLQVSEAFSRRGETVLYVSGEESVQQTKLRAERLGASSEKLFLVSETNLDLVYGYVEEIKPTLLVIDSVQTIFKPELASAPGSVSQVRECGARLLVLAKSKGLSVFLVGHVTKSGAIAGPRVLEHMVDTVLYFEGDRNYTYRILRAVKNRFGPTDEIGIFQMTEGGLSEVKNPSEIFLSQRDCELPGSVVVPCLEGRRPILVEIQALVSHTNLALPRRRATGLDLNRVLMILAVLERRTGMRLQDKDVFVNVAGGVKVMEPAADLGVVVAIASNVKNIPVDPSTVVMGELGLGGEIRSIRQLEQRLKESAKLGFQRAIVPSNDLDSIPGPKKIGVVGVKKFDQAVAAALNRSENNVGG